MTIYEIVNSAFAFLAAVMALTAIIRTRKIAAQQEVLTSQSNRISALTTLLTEYKNRTKIYETALKDGTVERENFSRIGMEDALADYEEKHFRTLVELENELTNLKNEKNNESK